MVNVMEVAEPDVIAVEGHVPHHVEKCVRPQCQGLTFRLAVEPVSQRGRPTIQLMREQRAHQVAHRHVHMDRIQQVVHQRALRVVQHRLLVRVQIVALNVHLLV